MGLDILEFFGYAPLDPDGRAVGARSTNSCPFVTGKCIKRFRDGTINGTCTVKPTNSGPVICCPHRIYAHNYRVLLDVAHAAFGEGVRLVSADQSLTEVQDGLNVAVFGKRWGKELRLPKRQGRGGYFVDWILAIINAQGTLEEFVAAEVQTIDTTGNYQAVFQAYRDGVPHHGTKSGGMNWENVSKRILPQIIYKGHVLRREPLYHKPQAL